MLCLLAATAAPGAWATMSGRVGDLSPRQKEALAKVSPHPGPAPPRAMAPILRRQRAGKGLGGGRARVRGERRKERQPTHRAVRGHPLPRSPPSAEGTPGKFGRPGPSRERALGAATWEEVVAWKPTEAAEGTKATFILGTGSRALGAGAGAGP